MKSATEIITPRLVLKSITPQLITALFNQKSEEEIKAFFQTEEQGFNHLRDMHLQGMETHRISLFYFLLVNKKTDIVLGDCGFHTWNKTHRRAELFYNLKNETDKRQGFMTEALTEVLKFGFEKLDLHRIQGCTANYNIASIKTLEHFGFTKEGTLREDYVVDGINEDSECYSLLKHEWIDNNNKKSI